MTAGTPQGTSSSGANSPEPLIEQTIEVAAPVAKVWGLVSDLPRLSQWSPQVVRTVPLGRGAIGQGTRLVNLNRKGLLVWPSQSKVVRFEPEREIAFRVFENHAVWSFTLEATDTGTRIVQRRELPEGLTALSARFTDLLLGGQAGFTADLREGMRLTLERIKAEAERG